MPAARLARVPRSPWPFSDWTPGCAAARLGSKMPGERMQPAGGEATVFVVTDDRTGLAVNVEPVRQGAVVAGDAG